MNIPPPDLSHAPGFAPELALVDTIYADDNQVRVGITRDSAGLYRLHPERWEISNLDVLGYAYWNPYGRSSSLTDDIGIAREMAFEALRTTPRSSRPPEGEG